MTRVLLRPVGEPVHRRAQHGDPSVAYQRDVLAAGRGRLLEHSQVEGQVAQIAEYVDRPEALNTKSGVRSITYRSPSRAARSSS
jgi:hypothetical protein